MKYEKIIKWVLVALFIVGIVFSFYGFLVGFESNADAPVDNILYCAYAFAAIAATATRPKRILRRLLGLFIPPITSTPRSTAKSAIAAKA